MKEESEVTELFLEISSTLRYGILKKLDGKNQKQSHLAKDLGMSLPESHRQFERLSKAELISKTTEGTYTLTPFGSILLKHLDHLQFLLQYKNYFKIHTLGDLPSKFVKRLSDLKECNLIEGAFVLNEKMIQIAGNGKYLRVISAHVPPDAFRQGLDNAKKTGKPVSIIYAKNTIIPKGFKKEFTASVVQDLILQGTYERRMIDRVQIYVVLNDKMAMVLFPDIRGNVDLNFGFVSEDPEFHEWCLDYHQYMWEKSGSCDISKFQES
jgi:predicted transcriptional regulator